jgi:excisionase family DNA binding protein
MELHEAQTERQIVGDAMHRNPSTKTADSGELPRAAGPADRPDVRPGAQESVDSVEPLWNVVDVGRYLRISPSSIYKMTARNAAVRIPHIHIGGKVRFRRTDVDRWLTLLTTSKIDALTRIRDRAANVIHGHDSQTEAR